MVVAIDTALVLLVVMAMKVMLISSFEIETSLCILLSTSRVECVCMCVHMKHWSIARTEVKD